MEQKILEFLSQTPGQLKSIDEIEKSISFGSLEMFLDSLYFEGKLIRKTISGNRKVYTIKSN